MSAGFTSWSKMPEGLTVLRCSVWAPEGHEEAWLGVAAKSRHECALVLKAFGVHGLKFREKSKARVPDELIQRALLRPGTVVATTHDGVEIEL